jgi:alpha,alpha-trehalase
MVDDVLDDSHYPQVSGELFRAVQEQGLFEDAKTFVDATPTEPSERIVERFRARRDRSEFDLAAFVDDHFHIPGPAQVECDHAAATSMHSHIDRLWTLLTRSFDVDPPADGALVALPNPHVVPGGRFREMYYWDTYFMAEGLAAAGRLNAVEDLVENIASLVKRFGFVPLGNRAYYGSRSQVPLFYRMLRILDRERGFEAVEPFLPQLEREYEFWMDGADRLVSGASARGASDSSSHRRVVHLGDGAVANRYWDDQAKPRPESYCHDRELAAGLSVDDRETLYRDVRAACESGWDFSSRWLRDADDLSSIRTTELLPVDLNAVLYGVETALAEWLAKAGDVERATRYETAAANRREVVDRHCWDEDREFYVDHCWTEEDTSERLTLAGVVPLFTGLATPERAARVAERLRADFLEAGGLVTTLCTSGEQWDQPNGWAPLQWMAVVGLKRYGFDDLAAEISERWLDVVQSVHRRTGGIAEKYDVELGEPASDCGEYSLQYGFGWTNGVALALESLTSDVVRAVEGASASEQSVDAGSSVQIQ